MNDLAESKQLARQILVCQDPDRALVLVQRLALLVIDDRGYSADEMYEWLRDDQHHSWNE